MTEHGAGRLEAEALGIGRAGDILDARNGRVEIFRQLVFAHDHIDLAGAVQGSGQTVAEAVDVDDFAVHG